MPIYALVLLAEFSLAVKSGISVEFIRGRIQLSIDLGFSRIQLPIRFRFSRTELSVELSSSVKFILLVEFSTSA